MSDKTKEIISGTVPRWATAIAMSICALFLHRLLKQFDDQADILSDHRVRIAVLQAEGVKSSEVMTKLTDYSRLLDNRISRLEVKNPN